MGFGDMAKDAFTSAVQNAVSDMLKSAFGGNGGPESPPISLAEELEAQNNTHPTLGTNPTPAKTLADYMKEQSDAGSDSLVAKIGDSFSEPQPEDLTFVANALYNPGFPAPAGGLGTAEHVPREHLLKMGDGSQDLSVSALKSLGAYLGDYVKLNSYRTDNVTRDPSGHRRGEALNETGYGGRNSFSKGIAQSDTGASTNFDTLSGGGEADSEFGGFFGADKLSELLTKDLAVPVKEGGPFDGDTILTHNQGLIQEKVVEVLEAINRYSPSENSPFINDESTLNESLAMPKGLWSVQTGRGKSEFGKYDHLAPGVSIGNLQNMALEVLVASMGHGSLMFPDMGAPSEIKNMLQWAVVADAAAVLPSFTQFGAGKLDMDVTRISRTPTASSNLEGFITDAAQNAAKLAIGISLPEGAGTTGATGARLFNSRAADDIMKVQTGGWTLGSSPVDSPDGVTAGPRNSSTYGTMNSFVEKFDGPFPVGMILITVYALIAVIVLGAIMMAIVDGGGKGPNSGSGGSSGDGGNGDPGSPWELAMGSAYKKGGWQIVDLFMELFGIPRMDSGVDIASAVIRGLMMFFGIPYDPRSKYFSMASLEKIIDVMINVAMAPGYYVVIIKQVVRDMEQINDAISGFESAMGVTGKISQVFKIIEAIFSSTTWRFMMIMAALGNINARYNYHLMAPLVGDGIGREGGITILNPSQRIHQGRFYKKDKDGKSIGAQSANSLLRHHALWLSTGDTVAGGAFPGIYTLETGTTIDDYIKGKLDFTKMGGQTIPLLVNAKVGNRLSSEAVEAYEKYVDLEYVPFTIQDLRTNEIISLPAFITSIGDSFSADYSDSHGYGRTDPVKTYSKTSRSIDLSFRLVAMNPDDFDYMWLVINKLVTLLYPQRSQGRIRTYNNGTKRFVQPFSQVPTASPVIRLRLGELFHSNYNVNRLASLFGDTRILDLEVDDVKDLEAVQKQLKKSKELGMATIKQGAFTQLKTAFMNGEGEGKTVYLSKGCPITVMPSNEQNPKVKANKYNKKPRAKTTYLLLQFEVTEVIEETKKTTKESATDKDKKAPPSVKVYKGKLKAIEGKVLPAAMFKSGMTYGGKNDEVVVKLNLAQIANFIESAPAKELQPFIDQGMKKAGFNPEGDKKALAKLLKNDDKKSDFFSKEKNAIVRSFSTTAGRGLAGVITQMSFEYGEATWGVDPEKRDRAPMDTTVTLSFSPIHDLPLGLDAWGNMIAPSHPVGKLNADPHGKYSENAFVSQQAKVALEAAVQATVKAAADEAGAAQKDAEDDAKDSPPETP